MKFRPIACPSAALALLVSLLPGCGEGQVTQTPNSNPPVTSIRSPFALEKVIVRSERSTTRTRMAMPERLMTVTPEERLQVIVNNACFAALSPTDRTAYLGERLTMDFSTFDATLPFQSFRASALEPVETEALETAAGDVPCLVGITNDAVEQIDPMAEVAPATSPSAMTHLDFLSFETAKSTYLDALGADGEPALVAVVDTGIDVSHPDLRDLIYEDASGKRVFNFTDDPDPDVSGHGTHVAGLAASVHDFNPRSIALMAVKVLGDDGSGMRSDVFNGVMAAIANDADVINMSLSGILSSGVEAYVEAFRIAINSGTFVVVAAGNSARMVVPLHTTAPGQDPRLDSTLQGPWPAGLAPVSGVIAVGSDDVVSGSRSSFSNYGPYAELKAPGCHESAPRFSGQRHTGLWSTFPNGQWRRLCGTSMAAPVLAGSAGLIYKHFRDGGQRLHPVDAENILVATARARSASGPKDRLSLTTLATWLRDNPTLDNPALGEDALSRYIAGFYNSFMLDSFAPGEAQSLARELRENGRSIEWLAKQFFEQKFGTRFSCSRREYSLLHLAATGSLPETSVQLQTCAYLRGINGGGEAAVDVALASEEMMALLGSEPELRAIRLFDDLDMAPGALEAYTEVSRQVRELLHRPARPADLVAYAASTPAEITEKIEESNEYFLLSLYERVLFRDTSRVWERDASGVSYWLGVLDAGYPRAAVEHSLYRSSERFAQARADYYLGQPLYFFYWQQRHDRLLNSSYDRVDLEEDIISIDWGGGATRDHLLNEAAFAARAFLAYHGLEIPTWLRDSRYTEPTADFIRHLYDTYFGRGPEPAGLRYWSDTFTGDPILLEAQIILGSSPADRQRIRDLSFEETVRFLELNNFPVPRWLR